MHDMDDETRKLVLGEALMSELKAIRENTDVIPEMKSQLNDVDVRLSVVESDIAVVKAVVRDISKQIKTHEVRLDDHDIAIQELSLKAA